MKENNLGLFSNYFLSMTCCNFYGEEISADNMWNFFEQKSIVDFFIKIENSLEYLKSFLAYIGDSYKMRYVDEEYMSAYAKKESGHEHYSKYYNETLKTLVRE